MPKQRSAGKENIEPSRVHDNMSTDSRKRKADAVETSGKGKARAVIDTEPDGDSLTALKADNRQLRSRITELSAAFEELRNLRYTDPEKEVQDIIAKAKAVQKGLESAIREHKDEVKRLRVKKAAPPSPKATAPASPPLPVAQPPSQGRKADTHGDSEALARARREGKEESKRRIQDLEEQLYDLQTEYAAEKKKSRQAPTAEPLADIKFALLSDLSGFTILGCHDAPRDDTVREFDCILSALREGGPSLHFRLIEHPDDSVSYVPELDGSRDGDVLDTFQGKYASFASFMRFNAGLLPSFSRRLLLCINGK